MSDQELEMIEGTVSSVIFQNEENGYTILKLDVRGEEVTVVGPMAGAAPGEYLSVRGRWTRHPTYGPQMKAEVVERRLPQSMKEIFHYLSSGAIKGVGKTTARLIIEEFGEDSLTVIEEDPEQLTKIKGITKKRARQIGEVFRQQMGTRRLMEFLTEHQLPSELAGLLRRAYGDVALEVVKANPYLLVNEEFEVEFSQADALALSLGVGPEDPLRLEAGLLFELAHNNYNNGHTFLPRRKLVEATSALMEVPGDLLEDCLDALIRRGEAQCERVAGQEAVYLPALYEAETYIAQRILEMSRAELLPPEGMDKLIRRIEREQHISYAPQQRQAVELAAGRQVMLPNGGPWSWRRRRGWSCSPAGRAPARPPPCGGCWPCLRPWGWRPPWPPPPAGRPSGWGSCAIPMPPPSTGCWRPASTPTPASWCLPKIPTTR